MNTLIDLHEKAFTDLSLDVDHFVLSNPLDSDYTSIIPLQCTTILAYFTQKTTQFFLKSAFSDFRLKVRNFKPAQTLSIIV